MKKTRGEDNMAYWGAGRKYRGAGSTGFQFAFHTTLL